MSRKNYDIIIVGTGVSGLFCALNLPKDQQILLITKGKLTESNSYLAQGGIATLKDPNDYASYYADTVKAGRYENDPLAVKLMIEQSPEIIEQLVEYGVNFDQVDGEFSYTKEGAHSTNRILHHKDITGAEITSTLIEVLKTRENITYIEEMTLIDIIEWKKQASGIVVWHEEQVKALYAHTIVLATGGVGGLFEHSTNYRHLTGDGLAIALAHRVQLKDVHYIQIHPTSLYTQKEGRSFLISEAVRGEGGILLDTNKERFVDELLPRDQVSCAILDQMTRSQSPYVYLSVTHLEAEYVKGRFPNIYQRCLEEGYDITKEPIPVTPAQHYFMGGIKVDTYGQTSMSQLYAVGETSCNSVHGANRLASNSLLESLVFAKRAADKIREDGASVVGGVELTEWQLGQYDVGKIQDGYQKLVLEEIRRRDGEFYDKWCKHGNQCG